MSVVLQGLKRAAACMLPTSVMAEILEYQGKATSFEDAFQEASEDFGNALIDNWPDEHPYYKGHGLIAHDLARAVLITPYIHSVLSQAHVLQQYRNRDQRLSWTTCKRHHQTNRPRRTKNQCVSGRSLPGARRSSLLPHHPANPARLLRLLTEIMSASVH